MAHALVAVSHRLLCVPLLHTADVVVHHVLLLHRLLTLWGAERQKVASYLHVLEAVLALNDWSRHDRVLQRSLHVGHLVVEVWRGAPRDSLWPDDYHGHSHWLLLGHHWLLLLVSLLLLIHGVDPRPH